MKKSQLSKLFTMILTLMLMVVCLSACKMNLPDTSKIGPDGQAKAGDASNADAGGAGDSGEAGDVDGDAEEDSPEVSDVTAGTVEEGYYSLYATLNDSVSVTVDAPEVVLKDKSASKAADIKDSAGDLNKARFAYLTAYYDGDESSAKEDLEEYEKAAASGAQTAAIKSFYGEIGKIFAQFDITNYDMTAPNEADSEFVTYDVYSSANEPFTLEFTFEGDEISDISFSYDGDLE